MKKPKIFTGEHLAKLGKINAQIVALFELTGTKMEGTHIRRETINALIIISRRMRSTRSSVKFSNFNHAS